LIHPPTEFEENWTRR